MPPSCTPDRVLSNLRPHFSKARWQNVLLLVLALQLGRTLTLWRLAVSVMLPIRVESCYQRLKRLVGQTPQWNTLKRAWVRALLAECGLPDGPLALIIDWTMHTDRCRSLWVMIPVGGRCIPLAFWLTANTFGGPGQQRAFEDAALRELQDWLPAGVEVLLIGDRGFGGRDRMRFVQDELGWKFVFRVTGDAVIRRSVRVHTRRGWRWGAVWERVDAHPPAVGTGWQQRQVVYGRGRSFVVNVVAVCQAAVGADGTAQAPVWYLATNLEQSAAEIAAWYALRMQIEETFRDYKDGFGMEREATRCPEQRLTWLLYGLQIAVGLELLAGAAAAGGEVAPATGAPRAGAPDAAASPDEAPAGAPAGVPTAGAGRYRTVSDVRRGAHAQLTALVLGEPLLKQEVRAAAAKATRMAQRPQVVKRRRPAPTKNRRRTQEESTA